MILYELKDLAELLPQSALGLPAAPDPAPSSFRGVAIHWWTYGLPTKMPEIRMAPKVPIRVWDWLGVEFSALSLDHSDTPPETTIERDRYLRQAVAIVTARNVIPEPHTLAWEVRLGLKYYDGVQIHVRTFSEVTGVAAIGNIYWVQPASPRVRIRSSMTTASVHP